MPAYKAPLDAMSFLLNDVLNAPAIFASIPDFAEVDAEVVDAVLAEAGKFCENELAPLNRQGDEIGCTFEAGKVTTAPGVRGAWDAFVRGGWTSLSRPAVYGGQDLPNTVQFLVDEMVSSANMSFGLFSGLTRGASEAIQAHATQELKDIWLPNMVSGRWTGAMGLTEPQAGTDLGLLRTRAEPAADGSYRISGTKIFISAGDHDLAENIVHLVLARLPDAPAGTRGISLFLVPKMLLDATGAPSTANAVSCGSIEHKMGIKGSPTCVMNFDGAVGWLVGKPHNGLAAMFTMMNSERLFVGVQGIGVAEAAYQGAAAYAKERLQGRDPQTGKSAHILAHPDVRRNLLTARAHAWGMRALAIWGALLLDVAERHPDARERQSAHDLVALITPAIKAAGSDFGFEAAIAAQQVFGGHGYIREWGMEQLVRDVRITQIYEGTNGVQAMDLVLRKLGMNNGAALSALCGQIQSFAAQAAQNPETADLAETVLSALATLRQCSELLVAADEPHKNAVAVDYLRLFTLTVLSWMWGRMALAAHKRAQDDAVANVVLALARFFADRILPQNTALAVSIQAGAASTLELRADFF